MFLEARNFSLIVNPVRHHAAHDDGATYPSLAFRHHRLRVVQRGLERRGGSAEDAMTVVYALRRHLVVHVGSVETRLHERVESLDDVGMLGDELEEEVRGGAGM